MGSTWIMPDTAPLTLSVTVKSCGVNVAGSMGLLNCTTMGALIGTPVMSFWGLV